MIDELLNVRLAMVVPSHSTGFKAISEFASQIPDAFVLGAVGTR